MGKIVLLDDLTINKIAAGEVIERPASVVKEMVENSIDAGAKNITIEIKNGGISYIRITDDGKGFEADDLEMAFERHATSKIRNADDLNFVKSMGFRGEALASIAAIANVELRSKTANDEIGHKIVVEGGQVLEQEEIACQTGTSIVVKNLFFNTPVRYKFLRKDFTESGYIEDAISRLALVNPEISFRLINSGKTVIQTNGDGNLNNVIFNIYGKDIAQATLPVYYEFEALKVSGVIGKSEISRSNRGYQISFINKRYVKDKIISSAIEKAYKEILPIGKYGFSVLNIEIDPSKVDVNVHPAKLEVRFQDENEIFKLIYSAVRETLASANIVSNATIKPSFSTFNANSFNKKVEYDFSKKYNSKPEISTIPSGPILTIEDVVAEKIANEKRNAENIEDNSKLTTNISFSTSTPEKETVKSNSQATSFLFGKKARKEDDAFEKLSAIANSINTENKADVVSSNEKKNQFENANNFVELKNNLFNYEESNEELNNIEKKDDVEKIEINPIVLNNEVKEDKTLENTNSKNDNIIESLFLSKKAKKVLDDTEKEKTLDELTKAIPVVDENISNSVETNNIENNTQPDGIAEYILKNGLNDISSMVNSADNVENALEDLNPGEIRAAVINNTIKETTAVNSTPASNELSANFEEMYNQIFGGRAKKEETVENVESENNANDIINTNTYVNMSLYEDTEKYEAQIKKQLDYKLIGVAFGSYIIIEIDNELYIVDEKSTKQRIMYENIRKNYFSNGPKDSQLLLLPDVITVSRKEMDIVRDNMDKFEKAGFQIEEFGDSTIKLIGAPTICLDLNTKDLFLEILSEINTVARTDRKEVEDKFLYTIACKVAEIYEFDVSNEEEVESVLQQLLKLPNPFVAPNGKATAIKMSRADIEKKFARRK